MRPHGLVYAYWNATDEPARFIDMFLNQDFNTCLDELAQTGATIKEKGISPDSQEAKAMFKKVQDKYEIYPRPDLTQGILEKFGLKKANY